MSAPAAPAAPPPPPPAPPRRWLGRLGGLGLALNRAEGRLLLASAPPGPAGRLLHGAQVLLLALRRHLDDHAGDRAAALAFATLLSLVPLLLLALAGLGALGFPAETSEAVRGWLYARLLPRAAESLGRELDAVVLAVADRSRTLGLTGLLFLLLAGWRLLDSLSRTFAHIWETREWRFHFRRVAGFWVGVLVAPFAIVVLLDLASVARSLAGAPDRALGPLSGFASAWVAATLAYLLFPARRTRLLAAAVGALVCALVWQLLRGVFAAYLHFALVTSTVLAGFGIVPVFLFWLYFSWATFIYGAEVAFVLQEYERALERSGFRRPRLVPPAPAATTAAATPPPERPA